MFAVRNDVFYVHARIPPNTLLFEKLTESAAAFLSHVYAASDDGALKDAISGDPYCPLCVRDLAAAGKLKSALTPEGSSFCFSAHVAALVSRRLVPIAMVADPLSPSRDVSLENLWPSFSGLAADIGGAAVPPSMGVVPGPSGADDEDVMAGAGHRACEGTTCAYKLAPEEEEALQLALVVEEVAADLSALDLSRVSGASSTGEGPPGQSTLEIQAMTAQSWPDGPPVRMVDRPAASCSDFQRDAECCFPDFDDMVSDDSQFRTDSDSARANSRKRHPFVAQRCLVRGFFPAHLGRDGLGGARQNMRRDKHPVRRHKRRL